MKKVISLALSAVLLLSLIYCSGNEENSDDNTITTTTTSAPEETLDPAKKPTPITIEEVQGIIDTVKEEYAAATEVTLSDGTVVSAAFKDPGITAESVASGETTMQQITDYAEYLRNIRVIACDRLCEYFPEGNKVVIDKTDSTSTSVSYLFLDPEAAGFTNASDAFSKLIGGVTDDEVFVDHIIISNATALYLDADTNETTLLCPSEEENGVLIAIEKRLYPESFTSQVTEETE